MCTETICKIILYVLNVAFFLVGGAILVVGIIALVKEDLIYSLVDFLEGSLANIFKELQVLTAIDLGQLIVANAIILVVIGGVLFGIGFFGCCGACRKNSCCLMIYSVIVLVICGVQIGVAVWAYVASDKLEVQIKSGLTYALGHSYKYGLRFNSSGPQQPINGEEIAWDYLQIELECCGVNNYTDYAKDATRWNRTYYDVPGGSTPLTDVVAPPTCCILTDKEKFPDKITELEFTNVRGCMTTGTQDAHTQGCYSRLRKLFIDNQTVIIAVFCVIVVIEVIAIAAACILKSKADKD